MTSVRPLKDATLERALRIAVLTINRDDARNALSNSRQGRSQ
jgi:enoyl-CoA hydratase/carnithine racemase